MSPQPPDLSAALLAQSEHVYKGFEPTGVVQVLNSVARLGLQPSDSQRRAMVMAHRSTMPRMSAAGRKITKRTMQQLGWSEARAPAAKA